jgi:glycosyltransferase involved in cell wall biosynthesis
MSNYISSGAWAIDGSKAARRHDYVVITPARNEAAFIELTIKSMVAQTIKPLKWVIVSDGSTDGTDDIVRRYTKKHDWIELVRMPERQERHFAGKVQAFNAGYAKVKHLAYDFVASLDADLSFDDDYFAFLLGKFDGNPRLGLAGTPFREGDSSYDYRFTSIEHVSGACQLFRKQCFEAIGGYVPVKGGGIDLIAVLTVRMKGWHTRTFLEKTCQHHRKQGAAMHSAFAGWFNVGRKDYVLGGHPVWEVFRWMYQMTRPPFVIGGCALLSGYICAWLRGTEHSISGELMKFRRQEQMVRLKRFLLRNRGMSVVAPESCRPNPRPESSPG